MSVCMENRCRIMPGWEELFAQERGTVETILKQLDFDKICPETEKIFRFAEQRIDRVSVVILGQDPYPRRPAATGRAFEVGGLTDWRASFRQVSLKNILRLICKAYTGKLLSWRELLAALDDGSFVAAPPDRLFASWEEQGVLLLNTSLTCEIGKPGAHRKLWPDFSQKMISYIDRKAPDACWFLWGADAAKAAKAVRGKKYISRHPMLSGGAWPDDFFQNPCFEETKNCVDWRGKNI